MSGNVIAFKKNDEPPTRVYLDLPPIYGARGPKYVARLGAPDGEIIAADSLFPLCDSARVLHARGVRGRIELWDRDRSFARMTGTIEKLARLTVKEGERQSPHFVRWRPFPESRERPKTAKSRQEVSTPPSKQTAAGGAMHGGRPS